MCVKNIIILITVNAKKQLETNLMRERDVLNKDEKWLAYLIWHVLKQFFGSSIFFGSQITVSIQRTIDQVLGIHTNSYSCRID